MTTIICTTATFSIDHNFKVDRPIAMVVFQNLHLYKIWCMHQLSLQGFDLRKIYVDQGPVSWPMVLGNFRAVRFLGFGGGFRPPPTRGIIRNTQVMLLNAWVTVPEPNRSPIS